MNRLVFSLVLFLSPFSAFAQDATPQSAEQVATQANGVVQEIAAQRNAALDHAGMQAGQIATDAAKIKDLQSQLDKANADLKAANDKLTALPNAPVPPQSQPVPNATAPSQVAPVTSP